MPYSLTLASKIKERASSLNISVASVLIQAGIKDKNFINKIENGTNVGYMNIVKIADVLNCPVDYLLGRTDDSLVLQTQDNSNVTVSETNQDSIMDTHVSLSDDITEMSEMIKKLPLVKRSEVILMIHKMLEEQ